MLTHNVNKNIWLREQDHPAISLPRWQHQADILAGLYSSPACMVLQFTQEYAQVVCCSLARDFGFAPGSNFQDERLQAALDSDSGFGLAEINPAELSFPFNQFDTLSCLKLYWPDGQLFGCIMLCDPILEHKSTSVLAVMESVKALLQSELKQMYLMHQVQRLSVQDELTSMLNPYGFSLMAPRQLSLSRRFGSHAGIVMIEEAPTQGRQVSRQSETQKIRLLARIISDNLREADVSARFNDKQFIILAFVDNESNLDILVTRLRKQIHREAPELQIAMGQSFFAPDAQMTLAPMQSAAIEDLEQNRLSMSAKIA